MPVSIKDIARLAEVSHSTVSRALRNSPLIPAATSERIKKIADEVGYSASVVARSLVTNKTEAVGVVVTSIADPFNGEVVVGIEELANEYGYTVILANSQADPKREVAVMRSFQARRVDGILVASSRLGALHTPLLSELGIPIVLLNNQHPSTFLHSVCFDNVMGALEATRHLIQLGHKRIGYLGDRFGLESNAERLKGYQMALREARLPIDKSLCVVGNGKTDGAQQAVRELFRLRKRPTAIVCYNDMSALGVLHEAGLHQISVPGELSITGFDDIFFAPFLNPPLTTVQQPKRELGTRAMRMLLDLIKGRETERSVVVRGALAVRSSTARLGEVRYQSMASGKNSATRSS